MNTEFFIAKHIASAKHNKGISNIIIKIAIAAVALSVAVMIISVTIVTGFYDSIVGKLAGFGAHILITNHDTNTSYETVTPISKNQDFYPDIEKNKGIKHIQVFALKPGIIKNDTIIEGVVIKGVDTDFDWQFFENNLVEGRCINIDPKHKKYEIIISKTTAQRLNFKVGDNLFMYFIENPPRLRKYKIVGIYDTGFTEFDKMFVITDIADIRKINHWKDDEITGFEIIIDDFDKLEQMTSLVMDHVEYKFMADGSKLHVTNIKQNYSDLFDWLKLTKINVWVILIIMIFVAFVNMAVTLLIIILERTSMIGILKALGMKNMKIRKIFIYNSMYIITKGLIIGNLIGVGLSLIQLYLKIIPLDPETYYMAYVPIKIDIPIILAIDLFTIVLTSILLELPTSIVTRIDPAKSIRFN